MYGYRGVWVQGCIGTGVYRYRGVWVQGCIGTGVYRYSEYLVQMSIICIYVKHFPILIGQVSGPTLKIDILIYFYILFSIYLRSPPCTSLSGTRGRM